MQAHKTAAGLSIATIFLNRFSSFREKILRKKRKISQASQKKNENQIPFIIILHAYFQR